MQKSESKFTAIMKGKCPKCYQGQMFKNKNPYNPKTILDMNEKCDNCGQEFTPEPGFYYGAMYVSYALGVAVFVAVIVAYLVLAPETSPGIMFATVVGALLILAPVSFRLSRKLWLHIFVKYDPPKEKLSSTKN